MRNRPHKMYKRPHRRLGKKWRSDSSGPARIDIAHTFIKVNDVNVILLYLAGYSRRRIRIILFFIFTIAVIM